MTEFEIKAQKAIEHTLEGMYYEQTQTCLKEDETMLSDDEWMDFESWVYDSHSENDTVYSSEFGIENMLKYGLKIKSIKSTYTDWSGDEKVFIVGDDVLDIHYGNFEYKDIAILLNLLQECQYYKLCIELSDTFSWTYNGEYASFGGYYNELMKELVDNYVGKELNLTMYKDDEKPLLVVYNSDYIKDTTE